MIPRLVCLLPVCAVQYQNSPDPQTDRAVGIYRTLLARSFTKCFPGARESGKKGAVIITFHESPFELNDCPFLILGDAPQVFRI